jgi:hypothetical protein
MAMAFSSRPSAYYPRVSRSPAWRTRRSGAFDEEADEVHVQGIEAKFHRPSQRDDDFADEPTKSTAIVDSRTR